MYNGSPHSVITADFVSPGKGSAFTRSRLRNLFSGAVFDWTFKTTESIELAEVETLEMQYLYNDGENYIFMNPRTYEQMELGKDIVDRYAGFLKEEMMVYLQLFNEKPIDIFMPRRLNVTVTYTEDAVAGDRANAPKKMATIDTGAEIQVPLFIKLGEKIIVDPETGTYLGRDNEK